MEIRDIISGVAPLPAGAMDDIVSLVQPVAFAKGRLVFRANKLEQSVYFMAKGIARVYYFHGTTDVTLCFVTEGEALLSLTSYIQHQPGYENIELLESSMLFRLKTTDLHRLYAADIHIANWGRKLAEQELLKTEGRLISKQFKTASERYKELIQMRPDLLHRVQLGYIASYLGISQVTLSRIRADIR